MGGMWKLGSQGFVSYEDLVLWVKRNMRKDVEKYQAIFPAFALLSGELRKHGGWEESFEANLLVKLKIEELGLSAADFEHLESIVFSSGQGRSGVDHHCLLCMHLWSHLSSLQPILGEENDW